MFVIGMTNSNFNRLSMVHEFIINVAYNPSQNQQIYCTVSDAQLASWKELCPSFIYFANGLDSLVSVDKSTLYQTCVKHVQEELQTDGKGVKLEKRGGGSAKLGKWWVSTSGLWVKMVTEVTGGKWCHKERRGGVKAKARRGDMGEKGKRGI